MSVASIGDRRLKLREFVALAEGERRIEIAPAAWRAIRDARDVVDRHAGGDAPVYGLNTGLGGNVGYRLSAAEIEAFQVQMIRGRCIGMGDALPMPVCRAALLCRIIGVAQGGAGLSPAVLELLVAMFNAGITPVIPGRGSIGAGDLGLCAHLGAAAIGLGEVWHHGARVKAAAALAAAGLAPARLGPKDGLGLINASAVVCGHGGFVLAELADLLTLAAAAMALAAEGYAANPAIFDARLAAARPAGGQMLAAGWFRTLLHGSYLHAPDTARSIQDALCFRIAAPVFGVVLAAFATVAGEIETEINAAADNPLVLADSGEMFSTANFHTPAIALGFDSLAIALAQLATASAHRVIKLMSPALSGLPRYLSPIGGASAGFNPLQKTVAALQAEIRLRATPASLDAIPVSDAVEDHAPQTPLTIRKLEEQLLPLRMLIAIEALTAAQAVDLRGTTPAPSTRILHEAIRAEIPMLTEDRETGADAMAVTRLFTGPALPRALHAAGAGLEVLRLR